MSYTMTEPGVMTVPLPAADDEPLLNPPPVLAKEGYHGILIDVVKVACRTSEASPVAVAANFLSMYSAMVGRVAFQHIGDGTCHARPFFFLSDAPARLVKAPANLQYEKYSIRWSGSSMNIPR